MKTAILLHGGVEDVRVEIIEDNSETLAAIEQINNPG